MSSSADTYREATRIAAEQIIIPNTTGVSVYQALYCRRMAWKFKDEAVPGEVIQRNWRLQCGRPTIA
jgi:hypothetical protein